MPRTFDEKELLERVDNDWDFLRDTVQMLADDGPALMAEIRCAAMSGDAAAVGRAAHTLKGMISNFCAPDAHERALAVEQIGRSGDFAPAGAAMERLEKSLDSLIADLTDFLSTRTKA
jgi:HPt (histidine-containing phosphotransfer) domain-containing protein